MVRLTLCILLLFMFSLFVSSTDTSDTPKGMLSYLSDMFSPTQDNASLNETVQTVQVDTNGTLSNSSSSNVDLSTLAFKAVHVRNQTGPLKPSDFHHFAIYQRLLTEELAMSYWEHLRIDLNNLRADRDITHNSDRYIDYGTEFNDALMQSIYLVFMQAAFQPSSSHILDAISSALPLALVARRSSSESMDQILGALLDETLVNQAWSNPDQPCAHIGYNGTRLTPKILLLLNPWNHLQVPVRCVFDAVDEITASLWYTHYYEFYATSVMNPRGFHNMRNHLKSIDQRWLYVDHTVSTVYFGSTYVAADGSESLVKYHVNGLIQRAVTGNIQIESSRLEDTQKDLIVLVSQVWYDKHSVYRTFIKQVESLTPRFRLILLHFESNLPADYSLFESVIKIPSSMSIIERFQAAAHEIEKIRPAMIFYPDVGMSGESVYLSNHRLAPIQVATYGHSVSTFGSRIDYWIGSKDVELISRVNENYSERLVLTSGLGVTQSLPAFSRAMGRPTEAVKRRRYGTQENLVIINCAWSSFKTNAETLLVLRNIADMVHTSRPGQKSIRLIFRMFPGIGSGLLLHSTAREEAKAILGDETVEVWGLLSYQEYMSVLEEGDFFLDSFPFGGCNTVMDALSLGKPILTLRGTRWHNRIGPAHLEVLGLSDLVASDVQAYVEQAVKMAIDSNYLQVLYEQVARANVKNLLLESERGISEFKPAFEYLINHHESLISDRESHESMRLQPIFIQAESVD